MEGSSAAATQRAATEKTKTANNWRIVRTMLVMRCASSDEFNAYLAPSVGPSLAVGQIMAIS
jgi:hypothetical protein